LPNNIQAGDTYTITLKTEEYDNRPQAGIDAGWDSDSYVRPVLDGGGGVYHIFDFVGDYFWYVYNIYLKNLASGAYYPFYTPPAVLRNILVSDLHRPIYVKTESFYLFNDIYIWNVDGGYGCIRTIQGSRGIFEHIHLQGKSGASDAYGFYTLTSFILMKNISCGKAIELNRDIYAYSDTKGICKGVNIHLASSSKVYVAYGKTYPQGKFLQFSDYNELRKFHQWSRAGEIYNVNEDATIDPPSEATTYIKMSPNSHCNSLYPLIHEEERYQSGASKTYTWKFYPSGWSNLTTSDIEIEAWFLEESSGTRRKYATANPSSVTNDTWNDLSITISPGQAGVVYFQIKLKKYELGAFIALDPKVDVS